MQTFFLNRENKEKQVKISFKKLHTFSSLDHILVILAIIDHKYQVQLLFYNDFLY